MFDDDSIPDAPQDFDSHALVLTGPRTDAALQALRRARERADEQLGYFRDYPDATASEAQLWSNQAQSAAVGAERAGHSWLAQLFVAAGALWLALRLPSALPSHVLRARVLAVAAVALAWVEAIDSRGGGTVPMKPALWRKVWAWILARVRRP